MKIFFLKYKYKLFLTLLLISNFFYAEYIYLNFLFDHYIFLRLPLFNQDTIDILTKISILAFVAFFFPNNKITFFDIFRFFYIFFILFPFVFSMKLLINNLFIFFILLSPILLNKFFLNYKINNLNFNFKKKYLTYLYLIFLSLFFFIIYEKFEELAKLKDLSLQDAKFNLRNIFLSGKNTTYLFFNFMNCVNIFYLIYFFKYKKYFYFLISFSISLIGFIFFGIKFQFFVVSCLLLISLIENFKLKIKNENLYILYTAILVFMLFFYFIVEIKLTNYSLFIDYIYRRLFISPAINLYLYSEYIINDISFQYFKIPYIYEKENFYIGEIFYQNESNVNTNFMFSELSSSGLIGVFFSLIIIFSILNIFYIIDKFSKNNLHLYILVMLPMYLAEQNVFVFLSSSGYFLALILLIFFQLSHNEKKIN